MEFRRTSWLAWSMCVVVAAAIVGAVAIDAVASSLDVLSLLGLPAVLAFSVVGALIATRRSDNAVGWILCAAGLCFALASFAGESTPWSPSRDRCRAAT